MFSHKLLKPNKLFKSLVALSLYQQAQNLYSSLGNIDGVVDTLNSKLEEEANQLMQQAALAEDYFIKTGQEMEIKDPEAEMMVQKN